MVDIMVVVVEEVVEVAEMTIPLHLTTIIHQEEAITNDLRHLIAVALLLHHHHRLLVVVVGVVGVDFQTLAGFGPV